MANVLAPFGFAQVNVLNGVPGNFANSIKAILKTNATSIYRGDPVTTQASGSTTLTTNYIAQSTAGTTQIAGIFAGCKRTATGSGQTTWSNAFTGDASSDVEAYVLDYPDATFMVQCNGQLLPSHVGQNANFALGTGNTATGISGATLDISTVATTNTLPFRIVDMARLPSGANGGDHTTPYSFAVVTFNNQDFKSLTGL